MIIVFAENSKESTNKLLEKVNLARLLAIRSIYKNQLYFYVLVTNNWKMKFKKYYLQAYSEDIMSSYASFPLHKLFPYVNVFPSTSTHFLNSYSPFQSLFRLITLLKHSFLS